MTRVSTLLLMVSFVFITACGDKAKEEMDELCGDRTTIEGTNCLLQGKEFRLVSVTSDIPRPIEAGGETSNWLTFQPECYRDLTLKNTAFLPSTGSGEWVGGFNFLDQRSDCDFISQALVSTDDAMTTAVLDGDLDHFLFFYGLDDRFSQLDDFWYNIDYDEDQISYDVDKNIGDVIYKVSVVLERVR